MGTKYGARVYVLYSSNPLARLSSGISNTVTGDVPRFPAVAAAFAAIASHRRHCYPVGIGLQALDPTLRESRAQAYC